MNEEKDRLDPSWWGRAPGQVKILVAALAAFSGTITAALAAWPVIEPLVYASRGYVREHVGAETGKLRREFSPTTAGMYDIQLSIARSRRSALNAEIAKMEIEVPKSDNSNELVARRTQIDRLKEERDDVDAEIKRLRTEREKN